MALEGIDKMKEYLELVLPKLVNMMVLPFMFALAIACNIGEPPSVSVSNTIEYFSATKGEKLIATCDVDKSGRRLGFYTIEITDNTGRRIAKMCATCAR